ncbi:LOW QUALITY PROTEIN: EG45-like domain containing protein [Manihot esculenta]|uniref:LOW QUALITY PROTEIN: EG45-like domain containing protein n=1 Tax=Manihot esculenta TaxID=3983 RepID=UPI001CC4CB31|nr:LOW QUALITY PROTEIN: EG45-like domain containing protein [Manihot esculenta]
MGIVMRIVVMAAMVLCLSSIALAAQGIAVWYKNEAGPGKPPYTPSKCNGNQDNGAMEACGKSDALWSNGAACGKSYRVSSIAGTNLAPHPCKQGSSVVVKIVNYCSRGCQGEINLSRDAFAQIADPDARIVKVQYDQ